MKVKEKKLQDGKIGLSATASAKEVNDAIHRAQIMFAKQMGLKPTRGKTIAEVAKEQMGVSDINSIVSPQAIESLVPFALDSKNLVPAILPKPTPKSAFKPNEEFQFELTVLPKAEYELTSYEPVKIKAQPFTFDDSLVDAQISQITSNYVSYVPDEGASKDREVKSGDIIKIALDAYEDGKLLDMLSTDGRTYLVGEGYMPPEFDQALVGMKAGETKEFSFKRPSFASEDKEAAKDLDAKVKVVEFLKEEPPTIDDEWVERTFPMFGTAEKFKAQVREELELAAKAQYDAYLRQLAAAEAAKRFDGSISDEIYEFNRDVMVKNMREELQSQGKTLESFIEENGGEQSFGMMLMLQVREMLTQGFALDAVFRHEKLSLTDEDIELAANAMNPSAMPGQLRRQMEDSGQGFALRESAERLKANNFLLENAEITYIDPEASA